MSLIVRNYQAEYRADETDTGVVIGVPIVLNTPTDIGGRFKEIIAEGAISDELLKSDVRFFWNHNIDEKALARGVIPLDKKGGMELVVNGNKIEMKARLNLERTDAKDLYLAIQDGVVNQMSFMFGVADERWEGLDTDYPTRVITKIEPLVEVSAVNFPAYKETSIGVRSDKPAETDLDVLDKARERYLHTRNEASELELVKLKAKYLYEVK